MTTVDPTKLITRFETSGGAAIFRLTLEVFPGFSAYVYLVRTGDYCVLIDTGSGLGESNDHLDAGLEQVAVRYGEKVSLGDLTHIFITHGHIDHFGGLTYIQPRSSALVGVHELDRRTLTHYEERLMVVAKRLRCYLIEAGISQTAQANLMEMYNFTKSLFHSVRVDITFGASGDELGPFRFLHVPGHCAGHVVIRLDDVLFSGDHVLEGISPHQAPERLTLSTGLDHYLRSLEDLRAWAPDVRLTLCGHNAPIQDLPGRIDAIRQLHEDRLKRVLEMLDEPRTIAQISKELFGVVSGYNVLLALEEAGAHVEYLCQRGVLAIDNLNDYERTDEPVPIRFRRA